MQNIYKRLLLLTLFVVAVPALSACNMQQPNTTSEENNAPSENNAMVANESANEASESNNESMENEGESMEEEKMDDDERVVKEFSMTSFTEIIDGKYFPQFSTKEIEVNKGDLVRIKVTVTSGTHDFKIDEFDVYSETPLNEEVVIEFVADKAGEFEYYCTKPNHRANGHWGKLTVLE